MYQIKLNKNQKSITLTKVERSVKLVQRISDITLVQRLAEIKLTQKVSNIQLKQVGRAGAQGIQGEKGDKGDTGASGSDAEDKNFVQEFTNSSQVTVTHNLNKYPAITVTDSTGDEVVGEIEHVSINELVATFVGSFTGRIVCN